MDVSASACVRKQGESRPVVGTALFTNSPVASMADCERQCTDRSLCLQVQYQSATKTCIGMTTVTAGVANTGYDSASCYTEGLETVKTASQMSCDNAVNKFTAFRNDVNSYTSTFLRRQNCHYCCAALSSLLADLLRRLFFQCLFTFYTQML